MAKIAPCLWLDDNVEEVAQFYLETFPNSRILERSYYLDGAPKPAGSILVIKMEISGIEFQLLNGGTEFKFSEAISFYYKCSDQEEIDDLWQKLTSDGGEESQCGWLKDKYGVSWQIATEELDQMIVSKDTKKAQAVWNEILKMKKIDINLLREVFNNN